MKRFFWILIAVILTFTGIDADAQRWKLLRYEVDLGVSLVSFYGDIGRAASPFVNTFSGLRPGFGITPRYMIKQNLAVSLDLSFLMFGGRDKEGESHGRLYSFNSSAFQHYVRMEYFLLANQDKPVLIYLYAGAGGLLSSATVLDENGNELVDNPGYSPGTHYGFGFPVGAGLKMLLDPLWSLGLEMGYHFTTSDFLDGSSVEGASNYNDSYLLITLKAAYLFSL